MLNISQIQQINQDFEKLKEFQTAQLFEQPKQPRKSQILQIFSKYQFFFDKIKCIDNQQCIFLCSNPNCEQNAIMCGIRKCKCKKNHQNCSITQPQRLTKSILKKIRPMDNLIKEVNKIFQKTIDWLSIQQQIITEKIKYFGLSSEERNFLKNIENNQNFKDSNFLKGTNMYKVLQKVQIQSYQFNYNEKVKIINQYWQSKKLNFYKIFIQIDALIDAQPLNIMKDIKFSNLQNTFCSKIIQNKDQIITLRQFFNKKIVKGFRLLYRASQHNFSTDIFYDLCSKIENTLILVQTEKQKKIGGFTKIAWDKSLIQGPSNNRQTIGRSDPQKQSFIFSLTQKDKFQIENEKYSIAYPAGSGPTFIGPQKYDLSISNKAHKNNKSCCLLGKNYRNLKYQTISRNNNNYYGIESSNSKAKYIKFCGGQDQNFYVEEWQVFQVIFYSHEELQKV